MVRYFFIFLFTLFTVCAGAQKNTNSLQFIENKGQWDARVKFMAETGNGAIFLRQNGFTVMQRHPDDLKKTDSHN
ncbi:MAG: hypothetical protein QM664_11650, partial [Flavihumibacter sp.]